MRKYRITSVLLFLGLAIAFGQDSPDRDLNKEEKAKISYEATKSLVESGQFEFIADRLISSTGYSNSIIGTPNTIRVNGDQVRVYLPYFGEVRANSPYQVDGGIKYEGIMEDYSVEFKDDKRRIVVKFSIDRSIEEHTFYMTINKAGHTRVTVISSGRTSISYYGLTDRPGEDWAK